MLPPANTAFDFGCGKLRYADCILESAGAVALVDSEIQISRQQQLRGKRTSIKEITRRSNRLACYNDANFEKLDDRFDRGFCINVLSAIPISSERRRVLAIIRSKLTANGQCLFVVQYRNSDFTRMSKLPNATRWGDGFILDSLRGHSFYATISVKRLKSMLVRGGFQIQSTRLNQGSAYIWASSSK